jgi:hypothetical protein
MQPARYFEKSLYQNNKTNSSELIQVRPVLFEPFRFSWKKTFFVFLGQFYKHISVVNDDFSSDIHVDYGGRTSGLKMRFKLLPMKRYLRIEMTLQDVVWNWGRCYESFFLASLTRGIN